MKTKSMTIGTIVSFDNPQLSCQLFDFGFDFVIVDLEHGHVTDHSILSLLLSKKPHNKVLIRLSEISEKAIKHALDLGSDGIIAPRLESMEELHLLIKFAFYPPKGARSVGLCRATRFGDLLKEYSSEFKPIILPQIESVKGLEIMKDVLSEQTVFGVFVGPYDLSFSLGIPGQFDHPAFINAFDSVRQICDEKDKVFCMYSHHSEGAMQLLKQGVQMVVIGTDSSIFQSAYKRIIQTISI